jgi:ribonucleotide reductase beta subunit family protein with ferritin-like domain
MAYKTLNRSILKKKKLKTAYHKQIISFAIPAMSSFLIEQNLMDKESIEKLSDALNDLAQDENLHIQFIPNTIVGIQKD